MIGTQMNVVNVEEKGIMEEWNIGMMGKKIKYLKPLFHHSNIPIFQCF
jgi:hypothetical protein